MIGIGYKKLAEELSLTIAKDLAYGKVHGYMTTLAEGVGYKDIFISACINDETKDIISKELDYSENKTSYRIMKYDIKNESVHVQFFDNAGTMDKIRLFIYWFYPLLKKSGALGEGYCPICKQPLNEYVCKFINNKAVLLHEHCALKISEDFKQQNKFENSEKANLGKGFTGALLGGLIGAIPWAIVYAFGWFVGWLGLLIGFLAQKGYYKFGGKSKKSTIAVICISIIISVIVAQILGDCFTIGYYILNGEASEFSLKDIPYIIYNLFIYDSSYVSEFVKNVLIGLVFAAIGAFQIIKNISKEVSDKNQSIKDAPQDI